MITLEETITYQAQFQLHRAISSSRHNRSAPCASMVRLVLFETRKTYKCFGHIYRKHKYMQQSMSYSFRFKKEMSYSSSRSKYILEIFRQITSQASTFLFAGEVVVLLRCLGFKCLIHKLKCILFMMKCECSKPTSF